MKLGTDAHSQISTILHDVEIVVNLSWTFQFLQDISLSSDVDSKISLRIVASFSYTNSLKYVYIN